jgi:hypothetical protein
MTRTARLATAFAIGRSLYGVALIAAPARIGTSWIGADAARRPSQVAIRGLGARDIALAAGTVLAAMRGDDLRPWLIGCVACDLADIGATLAAGDDVPKRARLGTVALAGGAALGGVALSAAASGR